MNPQGFAGLFGFVVAPSCFRDGAGGGAGGESGLLPSAVGLGGGVGVFVVSDSFPSAGGEGVGGKAVAVGLTVFAVTVLP